MEICPSGNWAQAFALRVIYGNNIDFQKGNLMNLTLISIHYSVQNLTNKWSMGEIMNLNYRLRKCNFNVFSFYQTGTLPYILWYGAFYPHDQGIRLITYINRGRFKCKYKNNVNTVHVVLHIRWSPRPCCWLFLKQFPATIAVFFLFIYIKYIYIIFHKICSMPHVDVQHKFIAGQVTVLVIQ